MRSAVTLDVVDGDRTERWPSWRLRTRVLVFLHGPSCEACARLLDQVSRRAPRWRPWGVEAVILREEAATFDKGLQEVQVPGGEALRRWIAHADSAVVVLDRQGSVAGRWPVRHPESPDWHEVDETVRWAGVQEPECGTCTAEPAWADRG